MLLRRARNDSQTALGQPNGKKISQSLRFELIAKAEEAVRGSPEQKSGGLTAGKLLNRFIKNKGKCCAL
jgi:hypothetical protein